MILQAHMSEVQSHLFTHWQTNHVDTLAVVGIIIGPVWGNDDTFTVSKGATTTRITWNIKQDVFSFLGQNDCKNDHTGMPSSGIWCLRLCQLPTPGTEGEGIYACNRYTV